MNKFFHDFPAQLSICRICGGKFQFKLLGFYLLKQLLDGGSDQFAAVLVHPASRLIGALQQTLWEFNKNALFPGTNNEGLLDSCDGHGVSLLWNLSINITIYN